MFTLTFADWTHILPSSAGLLLASFFLATERLKLVEKIVGNDAPQPPLPEKRRSEQQEYYGWQYDQDDATEVIQPRSASSLHPRASSQPLPPEYNPPPSPPPPSKGPGAQN